jgi:hypothetical protein
MPQRAQRHHGRPSKMPRVQALNLRSSQAANATDPNDVVDKDNDIGATASIGTNRFIKTVLRMQSDTLSIVSTPAQLRQSSVFSTDHGTS